MSITAAVTSVGLQLLALAILLCIIRSREGLLKLVPQGKPAGELQPEKQDLQLPGEFQPETGSEDADKLAELMAGGFYKKEKLTVKQLSIALGIPEYRVRRLINQTLGYRNFNDYINQLRVAEAAERLLQNPAEPVLNISLDMGYRTLSSFNRAFRDITGTTPTAYRVT